MSHVGCSASDHRLIFVRSVIFCEAVAIYGVIVAIILQTKVEPVSKDQYNALAVYNSGYAVLGAGSVAGWANLACGLSVGIVGSSAALSDAANFGVIVGIIMAGSVNFTAS